MIRRLLAALAVIALAGCTVPNHVTTVSATNRNLAEGHKAPTPAHTHWFTGRIAVEPAGPTNACLLLETAHGTYTLRPVSTKLLPIAFENHGTFDAKHSGIVHGRYLVASYGDPNTTIRGAQVAKADPVCHTHPELAFVAVRRGPLAQQTAATPTNTATTAPAAPTSTSIYSGPMIGGVPVADLTWLTGRISYVRGNNGPCLAISTSHGAYTLSSGDAKYDSNITIASGIVDPQTSGIHIHGRGPHAYAYRMGQTVTLQGQIATAAEDVDCSRYPTFGFVAVR